MSLSFDKSELSELDKTRIKKFLYFKVTRGLKEEFITCFSVHEKQISLPFYFGTKMSCYKRKNILVENNFGSNIQLRKEQLDVVKEAKEMLEEKNSCLLSLPTGFGKTIISIYLMNYLPLPIFVLVHRITLKEQWEKSIETFLSEKRDIFVGTKSQLSKLNKNKIGTLIVDECHCFYTNKRIKFLLSLEVNNLIFLSATPFIEDVPKNLPLSFIGNNIIKREKNNKLVIYQVNYYKDFKERYIWSNIVREVLLDNERDLMIKKIIEMEQDKKILILTALCEHAKRLNLLIENSALLIGSDKRTEDKKVMIGTISKLGVGFDPAFSLDNFDQEHYQVLILDCTFKKRSLITQIIGRILRREDVMIYQICDSHPIYRNHWRKIRSFYLEKKFIVKEVKIIY